MGVIILPVPWKSRPAFGSEIRQRVDELKEPIEPNAYVHGVDQFLNIRKEPSTREGTIITMLTNGTKIIVKDKKPVKNEHGEWYKVKVLNPEMDGYAMTKYIVVK